MIEVGAEESKILTQELDALMSSLAVDSVTRASSARLLTDLRSGVVPDERVSVLERVLEMLLSTDRVRRIYGPQEEQAVLRLYDRTPTGARLRQNLKAINGSLRALTHQSIDGLSFALKKPGVYHLVINTDQCELNLMIDRDGVSVDRLAVGL